MKIKTYRRLQLVCTVAFLAVAGTLTDWRHWQWWALLVVYVADTLLNYSEGMDRAVELHREVFGE